MKIVKFKMFFGDKKVWKMHGIEYEIVYEFIQKY